MKAILELVAKALRTGEARSKHDNDGGAWESALGLNPFLSNDAFRFLIATTAAPTRVGEEEIEDIPIAFANPDLSNPTSGDGFLLGNAGKFYRVTPDDEVTVIRPQTTLTALTNPTGGMTTLKDADDNEYAFLATFDKLVRWDFDDEDSTDHWNEGNALHGAWQHPFHHLFDSEFFGNRNYLGRIPLDAVHDQSTTLSNVEFEALRVGDDGEVITAIGDDGRYLIAAISRVLDATNDTANRTRLIWYSGVGDNWEWEATFEGEVAVQAIVRNALGVFAIAEQGIYQISFGQQPKLLRTFSSSDSILFGGYFTSSGARPQCAAPFGDAVIFGQRAAVFGRRAPSEAVTFSHPLFGHTDEEEDNGNISLIVPDFVKGKVHVGTNDGKFWVYDLTMAGSSSNENVTRWIDLNAEFTLMSVEIELPEGIGEEDVQTLKIEVPSGESVTVTISQDTVDERYRYRARLTLDPNLIGSRVRFTLTQSDGTPRLGGICLYGEPTPQA